MSLVCAVKNKILHITLSLDSPVIIEMREKMHSFVRPVGLVVSGPECHTRVVGTLDLRPGQKSQMLVFSPL